MKQVLIIVIMFAVAWCQGGDIQITQIDFISNFSLGKQDQLNRTFTVIQEKMPSITDVTYIVNETTTYIISNISRLHFFYIDSKQKATIQDQTVIISGGHLQADFNFSWTRKSSSGVNIDGSASGIFHIYAAFGTSNDIIFTKSLVDNREEKSIFWNLTQSTDISFDGGFKVFRVHPQNATSDDLVAIAKALNSIQDRVSVKDKILENINSLYTYNLKLLLHDQRHRFDGTFNYTYDNRHSGKKFIVNFTTDLKDVHLDRTGIKFDWKTQIKDDPAWKFLNHTIGQPFDVRIYGGLQELVSFTVYENLVRYAIKNGMLDSSLNRRSWQSRFFQFYAGDLYEIIPKVAQNFRANQQINGNCIAIPSSFTLKKATEKTLNVTIQYDCQLNSERKKIIDFNINLTLELEGRPRTDSMMFAIVRWDFVDRFSPYMDYKVENIELAHSLVKHSLNRLPQTEVFGNGWHLFTRDYPHFQVEHNYTLVYDSTHVDDAPSFKTE